MIKVPKNKIEFKYTSGGEYIVKSTYQRYQGHYYELSGKVYAGKEFNVNAPLLVKVDSNEVNRLITSPNQSTSLYGAISGMMLPLSSIVSIPFTGKIGKRFFAKKNDSNSIKEISEDTFNQIQSDPLYTTQQVDFRYDMSDKELDYFDKNMPGLKTYLEDDLTPKTSSPEDGESTTISQPTPPKSSVVIEEKRDITSTPRIQDIVPVGPIYIIK
jgi:hypothetical protein